MHVRMRMIIGLLGLVALAAVGLPALWNHPDLSGFGGSHEAMAGGDVMKEAAQEHVDAAKEHDREAEHHEAGAQRYEQKASAITPLLDPKGYRRDGDEHGGRLTPHHGERTSLSCESPSHQG